MALTQNFLKGDLHYRALSTDIAADKIAGISKVGAKVYLEDTTTWKLVTDDLTLVDYVENVTIGTSDIQIGAVEIKDATTDNRMSVDTSGRILINSAYDAIAIGNLALDGNTQQLDADTASSIVSVQADPDNAGYVYVGDSNTTDSVFGAKLTAGSSVTLNISNVNLVYVKGTALDNVSFIVEV